MPTYKCTWPNCGQVYKAKGWLDRHVKSRHSIVAAPAQAVAVTTIPQLSPEDKAFLHRRQLQPQCGPRPTFTALFTEADLNDPEVESNAVLDDVGVCSRPWQAATATATAMATVTVTATAAAAMDIVGLPDLVN